jgi:HPt (histidine-containing phosphotransfer) domain-containing protein
MNVTLNTNVGEQTTISTETLAALLAKQVSELPVIGQIDLFGETQTAADLAHAMRELARVATIYADAIGAK